MSVNKNNGGEISPFDNCEKDFEGITFGENDSLCAVKTRYTILGRELGQDGVSFSHCDKFLGKTFGPHKEYCACKFKEYSMLTNLDESNKLLPFSDCESKFQGTSVGKNHEGCVVKLSLSNIYYD